MMSPILVPISRGDNGGQFSMPLVKNFRVLHCVVPHYGGLGDYHSYSWLRMLGYPIWVVPHHWGTLGDRHSLVCTYLSWSPNPQASVTVIIRLGNVGLSPQLSPKELRVACEIWGTIRGTGGLSSPQQDCQIV